MMSTQRIQVIFISFIILSASRFFGANFLNEKLLTYTQFFIPFITMFLAFPFCFPKWIGFVLPVQLMTLSILTSLPVAFFTWDQSLEHSLLATIPVLLWPLFFYLNHIKIPINLIERMIICFGIAYVVIYLYQYSNPATMLFGKSNWGDEFQEDRGVIRIIPQGSGIFFLSIFIALNKLTARGAYKWLWLLLVILGVIVPVMQVTRVFILGVAIIYTIHFIRGSLLNKALTIVLFGILTVIVLNTEIKQVEGMLEAQKENANDGKKYIRVLAGTYYLTEFSPQYINYIFGNGVSYWEVSKYGKVMYDLNIYYGYYLEDLGIISVYVMFGIFAVIAYMIIWIISFRAKIPDEYLYVKYFLWFLLMNSLTTGALYTPDFSIATVLALHIFHSVFLFERKKTLARRTGYKALHSQRAILISPENLKPMRSGKYKAYTFSQS